MHVTELHVVLVDDELDVHEVSRLALRKVRVYGLPLKLHSATSKAEAIEVLNRLTLGRPDISMAGVALIDVVMETEHAGLELCDHIRNVMKNRCMQIYVRTGQPGVAPERTVLDDYDIQGYLAKTEVTADKLYTIVKAGVRGFYFTAMSLALQDQLHFLAPLASSRSRMRDGIREWQRLVRLNSAGDQAETLECAECYLVDDEVLGFGDWSDSEAAVRRRDELAGLPATVLNEDGDSYSTEGRDLLIKLADTATNSPLQFLMRGTAPAPDWEVFLYHRYLRTFSALWKQAD